jgi:hypothetical protein
MTPPSTENGTEPLAKRLGYGGSFHDPACSLAFTTKTSLLFQEDLLG